jgi:hypothetical protein
MTDLNEKFEPPMRNRSNNALPSVGVKPRPEGPQFRELKTCKGCVHFKSEYWSEPSGDGETYDSGTSADCLKAGRSISTYSGSEPTPPEWCPLSSLDVQPAQEPPKLYICHSLETHFNEGWTLHMHQGGGVSFIRGATTGRTYSLEEGLRAWAMAAAVHPTPAPSPDVAQSDLMQSGLGLKRIVEEIDGAMNHGTWRDDQGTRLKDTQEWVQFYNALAALAAIKGE